MYFDIDNKGEISWHGLDQPTAKLLLESIAQSRDQYNSRQQRLSQSPSPAPSEIKAVTLAKEFFTKAEINLKEILIHDREKAATSVVKT